MHRRTLHCTGQWWRAEEDLFCLCRHLLKEPRRFSTCAAARANCMQTGVYAGPNGQVYNGMLRQ